MKKVGTKYWIAAAFIAFVFSLNTSGQDLKGFLNEMKKEAQESVDFVRKELELDSTKTEEADSKEKSEGESKEKSEEADSKEKSEGESKEKSEGKESSK